MFNKGESVSTGTYRCLQCGEIITMPLPMEDYTLPSCPSCGNEQFEKID
ncbi:MAG: zinc ribbon-containing protein [Firmicutes bacterium]|nr:zinc ribbon-containing protein [Bacillota bacterium]